MTGKVPQVWHPETSRTEPVSYRMEGSHTTVWLDLTPGDAVFVVFDQPATQPALTLGPPAEKELARADDQWSATFQPG